MTTDTTPHVRSVWIYCDNCGHECDALDVAKRLHQCDDLGERLSEGREVPYGECSCGAFMYRKPVRFKVPAREPDDRWDNTCNRLRDIDDCSFRCESGETLPIELGLFCEGEWAESVLLSIDRARELLTELEESIDEAGQEVLSCNAG